MNKLQELFTKKNKRLLSLFFTAGYPELSSTTEIIKSAEKCGIDFLEVGIPYSDPLADGPVIQKSSTKAIAGGMTVELLFKQLHELKSNTEIPLLLMGYLNPVLQYGIEKFIKDAGSSGVSGIILPDLPLHEYTNEYKELFEQNGISIVFLVTPQTSEKRIRLIDEQTNGFIYVVSSAATTGKQSDFGEAQQQYFKKIKNMKLKNLLIGGFGIHNEQTLQLAWNNLDGAICGSAFLKKLAKTPDHHKAIKELMKDLGLLNNIN